jgi:DNA-binding HxlR family transcriptional regulator
MLIVRDLLHGRSRFKEFMSSPESPPTNILSERLNRLVRHGLVKRAPAQDGSKHQAYELTQKGEELRPVLQTLRDWGLRWIPRTEARISSK